MLKPLTTEEIRLLELLEEDGLRSDADLSEILRMAETEVATMRRSLMEDEILLKIRAVVNWEKIESPEVTAIIQVTVTPSEGQGYDEVARTISGYKEVSTCTLVSGSFDLLVEVEGPSLKDVAFFVSDKLATIPGVERTATNFLLKRYKQSGDLFSGSGKTRRMSMVI